MKLPDTRTVSLVARLADEIAGAVHTARTYQEKQRETEMRRTLAAVGLAASRDLELERVLERVANEIAELMRYDLMVVALADPDRTALRVRYQVGAEVRFSGYETAAEGQGRLLLPPRRRSITSLESYPEFAELGEAGFKSLLEVSFGMHEAATLGYMALVAKDEAAFSRQNLELMKHLAAHVSPAVQNALAHEQSVALAEARTAEAKAEARSLELERINQAKSQFLGVVSHELRTPLTSISAYSELLQRNAEGNLNERQVRQATVISESARHLKFLISDLLDVSRIESGNFSLEIARFGLRSLVEEVAERLRPVLVEKSQELDLHVARGRLEVDGDRRRIAQVISNIIENASKYSPAGTAITLDVHRRRDEILVSVRDRGIGISAEDQQQLFTPFFRANSGLTRTEPGTGLGLSLVKKISELHGGTVSVKSRPGEGSTFTVTLHAAKMAQAA
jgi:signal transduction histidine kinase